MVDMKPDGIKGCSVKHQISRQQGEEQAVVTLKQAWMEPDQRLSAGPTMGLLSGDLSRCH